MTSDSAERVIYNRNDASSKVTVALYAVEDAVNAIENTISALRQYITDAQESNRERFQIITSGKAGITRNDIVVEAMLFHGYIENEYYPLLHDIGLFATFLYDKPIIDKKIHKKLVVERKHLLKLIQETRYHENQLDALL